MMEFHEIANIFPDMSREEYTELKNDVSENGLHEPIWTFQNKIIDGRHRYKACQELGIEPQYRTWNGSGSLVAFVISQNLHRRHLNSNQKAFIALNAMPYLGHEAKKRQEVGRGRDGSGGRGKKKTLGNELPKVLPDDNKSAEQAAKLFGTNRQYVADAEKIRGEAPEYEEKIFNGGMTIPQAKKAIRKSVALKTEIENRKNYSGEWIATNDLSVIKCDMLITDPPYGILNEKWEPKDIIQFTAEWAKRWNDCGAETFFTFWSQDRLWSGKDILDSSLSNYQFQQLLIWHYPNNKSPQSRRGFKQTWEPIFFYRLKESHLSIGIGGGDWGNGLNDFDCHVAAVPQGNFTGEDMKQHPAQKPVSVFRWLINAATIPGQIVCDPFMGSGTSGIAARQLKRAYHGIEINDEFLEIARGRITTYGI